MSLEVDGTLRVDGPYGPMVVRGRGRRVEVRVTRLRSVPSMLRCFGRRGQLPPPLDALASFLLSTSDMELRIGTKRWQPVRVVSDDSGPSFDAPLRLSFHPFHFA